MYEKNKIILIVLPGVPSEMKSMLNHAVLPIIEKKIKLKISSINIRTTGLPESVIFENIRNFFKKKTLLMSVIILPYMELILDFLVMMFKN